MADSWQPIADSLWLMAYRHRLYAALSTFYPIVKHIASDVNDVATLRFQKNSHSGSGRLKGREKVSSHGAILLWSPGDALRPSQCAIQVEKLALTRAIGLHWQAGETFTYPVHRKHVLFLAFPSLYGLAILYTCLARKSIASGPMTSPLPALSSIHRPVNTVIHQPHEKGAVAGIVRRDGQGKHRGRVAIVFQGEPNVDRPPGTTAIGRFDEALIESGEQGLVIPVIR